MGRLTPTLLAVALVAGAALWNAWCDNPRVRRAAALAASSDSLDRAVDSLNRELAQRAAAEAARQAREQRTNDSLARLAGRLATAEAQSDTLQQALDRYGAMIPSPVVAAVVAAKDEVAMSLRLTVALQRAQLADSGQALADLRRDLGTMRTQRDAALAQRDAWRRERRGRIQFPCASAGATVPQLEARVTIGVCVS